MTTKPTVNSEDLTLCPVYQATKARYDKMTAEELYQDNLNNYRAIRNEKLKQSDIYMSLFDRYTEQQINELKKYRQDLRDLINNNHENFKMNKVVIFPSIPTFL